MKLSKHLFKNKVLKNFDIVTYIKKLKDKQESFQLVELIPFIS